MPSPPSFDCNSSIDDGAVVSETGEATTTSPIHAVRCSQLFHSNFVMQSPKPRAFIPPTGAGEFGHLFKTMSWFDLVSNDKYILMCKSPVGYLPRKYLSSTRTKALHGSNLFRALGVFNYCDVVLNTCPLHLNVTQSRGWGGGVGGLLGSCRRFLIRLSTWLSQFSHDNLP